MIKRKLIILILPLYFIIACDKGLFLPQDNRPSENGTQTQEGGNPLGFWLPDTISPVEITILDYETISELVDSLILETNLEGTFVFEEAEICSIFAILNINSLVYLLGATTPLIPPTIIDTLSGAGPYEIIDQTKLHLPIQSSQFKLDTLNYSVNNNRLDMISQKNIFNYMGIIEIPLYFNIHLIRSNEVTPLNFINRWVQL
jgi:hypothetical protein